MRQAAGSWLEGPTTGGSEPRGARLGLPAEGPGSLASPGARVGGFVVDAVVANLLAGLPAVFGAPVEAGSRGTAVLLAFLLQEFVLVSLTGATIGKHLFGIRVVRLDGDRLPWAWVLVRTLLLGLLVPAVIWDRDGRGLHDRAAGALTLRVGRAAPASSGPTQAVRRSTEPTRRPAGPAARTSARPAARKSNRRSGKRR